MPACWAVIMRADRNRENTQSAFAINIKRYCEVDVSYTRNLVK